MTEPARIHETHVSVVLLIGDRAFKIKKPVTFPFIDLSTPELRDQACHREVELNRRLAPDVNLGVADVVGPDGAVCDHLVVMRRMPAESRLSTLISEHAAGDEDKVACLRGDPQSADEARALLDLALRHLRLARVVLTLIGGEPGSGKSSLATGIAERTGWAVLRSDEVRKDLAGVGHTDRMASAPGTGIYTREATDATYSELLARARLLLARAFRRRRSLADSDRRRGRARHRRSRRGRAPRDRGRLMPGERMAHFARR